MEKIPSDVPLPDCMPIMVLGDATHFPRALMPLYIFEQRYRDMLAYALEGDRMFGVATAIPGMDPDSAPNPVRPVFTAGLVRACIRHDNGTSHLMLQGLQRVEIIGWDQVYPFRIATIIPVENVSIDQDGEQQLAYELIALCQRSIETGDFANQATGPMAKILEMLSDPVEIADMVGHNFVNDPMQRQELLEIVYVKDRLDFLIQHIKEGAKGM